MNPGATQARALALQYLRIAPGSPWRWEEDSRALVWSDGTTFAFREEVNAVIDRLAPRGLPPFAAVAVLLAGCRGKFPPPPGEKPEPNGQVDFLRTLALRSYQQALAELAKLPALSAELTKTAGGKAALAEAILEETPRSGLDAVIVWGERTTIFSDVELNTPPSEAPPLDLHGALWAVATGLRRHTVESLTRRLKTGLDQLPASAPVVELPAGQRVRRLLQEIGSLDEYAGLAAVTRDLMAAIRLPTAVAAIEELALGGCSGLGNRGPLDRLLLSELAHDDLTLATRIALNEAVYLQREPPALKPEHALVIVLDSGLRMWGVPRVVAASAAMALVAGHHSSGAVHAWRAAGGGLEPVDLLSKTGLDEHFAVLRPELDFREALPALEREVRPDDENDVVFITHPDALRDGTFAAALGRLPGQRSFVLTIDNDGRAALYTLPWGSPRPLAEARVEVDRLFAAPERRATPPLPLLAPAEARDLPAFLHRRPCPLLLPVTGRIDRLAPTPTGGLAVVTDRRLLQWEKSRRRAARQLTADLPAGKTCWLRGDAAGRAILVKGRAGDGQMSVIIVPPQAGEPIVTRFTGPQAPHGAFVDQETLLVFLRERAVAVALETGAILGETDYPAGLSWCGGRYFKREKSIVFASWTGGGVRWDETFAGKRFDSGEVVLAFDREGVGAWLLLRDGSILSPTGAELMKTGFPVVHAVVVDNGNTLFVTEAGKAQQHVVRLESQAVRPCGQLQGVEAIERGRIHPPTCPMQSRFVGVYGAPGQPLRLRKAKGPWLEIHVAKDILRLAEASGNQQEFTDGMIPLTAMASAVPLGCTLKVATWPGGSRAWIDSRGLLHLRSGDASVLQLTLTLNQGQMAAWSEEGTVYGPEFFTGRSETTHVVEAARILEAFCRELC